ncbi:HlyC/CorC family transporter [Enterococcus sp. BWR-S5]|uniref:HlyC/CorC family transporter n=1 Tax=Enterococcus sp. BWR-S5 TaxID=2787714 RepID=UPI0019242A3D|nr:hemolysin family protein [Enterococcus sp. BWR-S5]MBL1223750.1 HlyC/CorC family transporter [Enterococcus sp. BWR-S5]
MDPQIGMMLPVLLILILLSAFFSSSETAYSSLNRIRMMKLAEAGDKRAKIALELLNDFDRFLSAVLIGNNIVNIASSSIATMLFVAYFGNMGVTLSTVVMTIVVLIFAEISPKTIAKESPEYFALAFARPLKLLIMVLSPLTLLFAGMKKILVWLMPKKDGGPSITEEELLTLVEEAVQEGSIDEEDEILIKNVVEFNDLEVQDIYTPRPEIVSISSKKSLDEISDLFRESGLSRLPYYDQTIDQVIGVVNQKDFYYDVLIGAMELTEIVKPVLFIHKTMRISELMKKFQMEQSHLAIVVDEYGGTEGLVTLEDVVEELVGEIWDEHDDRQTDYQKLNERQYLIQGAAEFDVLEDLFNLENDTTATTLGGYIMSTLGHVPTVGEVLEITGLKLEIKKMDEHRVDEVMVTVIPEQEEVAEVPELAETPVLEDGH